MSIINAIQGLIEDQIEGLFSSGGSPIASATDLISGDVEVIDLMLVSEDMDRSFDLRSHCKMINVYESIICPIITAEFDIADSIGLMQDFPIIGEEFVKLTFKTPGSKKPTKYMFRVNVVKNRYNTPGNKLTTYTLECVSSEIFTNSTKLISKKYKDTVSSSVRSIIDEELKTRKKVNIEETKGIDEVLVTRMEPFKAIDFLRRRGVSKKNSSSSYTFFENKYGYNFITIEKLIEDGKNSLAEGGREYYFDATSNNLDFKNVTTNNIIAFKQASFVDSVSKLQRGGLRNSVKRFDLITGNITTINYNSGDDDFKTTDNDGSGQNTSSYEKKHGKQSAVSMLIPFSSENGELQIAEKISKLGAFSEKLTQNMVYIHIYGDSDLTVGEMLTCNFPKAMGSVSDDSGVSRLDSGNYLIGKLRHMIVLSDRPQHTISCELLKNNMKDYA